MPNPSHQGHGSGEVSRPEKKERQTGNNLQTQSAGNEALGALGIEFEPSSDKAPSRAAGQPLRQENHAEEREMKLDTVSFHSSNRRQSGSKGNPPQSQTKRKEINLSELRQALEESLKNQKEPDNLDYKAKNSEEELENRREEEKNEDKSSFPEANK